MGKIEELVKSLNNFRTRKTAKSALIDMNGKAVDPLCKILEQPLLDNTKWSLIDILGRIGSEKAIPVLKKCAQDPTFTTTCNEIISKLTGEDAAGPESEPSPETQSAETEAVQPEPTDPSEAPASIQSTDRETPPPPAQPVSASQTTIVEKVVTQIVEKIVEVDRKPFTPDEVKKFVQEIVEEEKFEELKKVKNGFKFIIKTDKDRRRQKINLIYDSTQEDGSNVVTVYSTCCEAKPDYYEKALLWNKNIAGGTICLIEQGKSKIFTVIKHISFSEADKSTLLNLIKSLGDRADTIEKVLTGCQDIR